MGYNPYICIFCDDVEDNGWAHCGTFDCSTASMLTGHPKSKFMRGTFSVCIECLKKIPCQTVNYDIETESEKEYGDKSNDDLSTCSVNEQDTCSDLIFESDELEYEYYSKKMLTDDYAIDKFPDEVKEKYPELFMTQVRARPSSFEWISTKIQNAQLDLCMLAIELCPNNLRYLWNRDPRVIKRALELDGLTLRFVYKSELTLELCMTALQSNPDALKYVRNASLQVQCKNMLKEK